MSDKNEIFLDAARSHPPSNYVLEAFSPYKEKYWCSPRYLHNPSQKAYQELSKLWEPIYELVQAPLETSVLTGDFKQVFEKLIYHTYFTKALLEGKTHFFVSSKKLYEKLWEQIERSGCFVFEIPKTDQGIYDYEALKKHLSQKTALVIADWAEPFSGLMQPVEELSFLCEKKEVDLYVNASHVVGKMLLLFKEIPLSFVHFETTSLQSAFPYSLLFTRKNHPYAGEFNDQELSISLLSMLSASARQALLHLDAFSLEMARLRDHFEKKLQESLPSCEKIVLSSYRLPHVSLFYFPQIFTETLAYFLNEKKVYIAEELTSLKELLKGSPWEKKLPFLGSFSLVKNTALSQIEEAVLRITEQVKALQLLTEDL